MNMLFPSDKTIHFVSGLWLFEGNPKHSESEYLRLLPETMKLISGQSDTLTFFCGDERTIEAVERQASDHPNFSSRLEPNLDKSNPDIASLIASNTAGVSRAFQLFPQVTGRLPFPRAIRHDKSFRKFFGQVRRSNLETYSKMVQVYFCRLFLMEKLAFACVKDSNPEAVLCWIDAGFGRRVKQDPDLRRGYSFDINYINHLPSPMYFLGRRQEISGKLVLATASNWIWLAEKFREESKRLLRWRYLHDDETVMNWIWRSEHSRFTRLTPVP